MKHILIVNDLVHLVLHPNEIAPTFLNWIRGRRGRVLILLYPPRK